MLSYQKVDVARYKRALEIIKREKRRLRGKGIILDFRNENFSFITDFINKIENFLKLIEDAQNFHRENQKGSFLRCERNF